MAAVTVPAGRSLLGAVVRSLSSRAASRGRASRIAAVIADHVGTLAALGFADAACWHWGSGAGLIGTAVCILVAEFKVRG